MYLKMHRFDVCELDILDYLRLMLQKKLLSKHLHLPLLYAT